MDASFSKGAVIRRGAVVIALLALGMMLVGPGPASAHREKGESHLHLFNKLDQMGMLTRSEGNASYAASYIATGSDLFISSCNPTSETYIQCGGPGAGTQITLAKAAKVLVMYGWTWSNEAAEGTLSLGRCKTTRNGADTSGEIKLGLVADQTNGDYTEAAPSIVDVQGPLAAGAYTFGLTCNETVGDLVYKDIRIAVLVMGG